MDIPRLWGTHRVGVWQMRPVGQIWLVFVSKVLWNAVLPTGLIWSLAAFCLAAVQASGEVTTETETSGSLQKSLLMPVLEPCYSKKDLWSSSRSTWGSGRNANSQFPFQTHRIRICLLKRSPVILTLRKHSNHWCMWLGGGSEAADEEMYALILYIDTEKCYGFSHKAAVPSVHTLGRSLGKSVTANKSW